MSESEEHLDPRENPGHPRHQFGLIGHEKAETQLLEAYKSERFHHAWLLCGPEGIGKATLAYRLARFILANPDQDANAVQKADSLGVEPANSVAQRIKARGHSDLFVLQRELNPQTKKLRPAISVDEARRLGQFYTKTAGEGGWRVCIIDAADDLNASAANAILKILEEPPEKCLFIVVSHAPGKLLATIRSRCLKLELTPLTDEHVLQVVDSAFKTQNLSLDEATKLISLGQGSPGKVLQLMTSPGARQFINFQQIAQTPSSFTLAAQSAVAQEFQKRGSEIEFNIFAELLSSWLGRNARTAAAQSRHQKAKAFADSHSQFSDSIRRTNALNLDRRQTLMMAFDDIENIIAL